MSSTSEFRFSDRYYEIHNSVGPAGLGTWMKRRDVQQRQTVTCPPAAPDIDDLADFLPTPTVEGARRPRAPMLPCIHEAGHAVAHWFAGVPCTALEVFCVSGFEVCPLREDCLAREEAGEAGAMIRGRMAAAMEMLAAYAGPCAQARYSERRTVRRPGELAVRKRSHLSVEAILLFCGGEWDLLSIMDIVVDWPAEGVMMVAAARRLAAALVCNPAAWNTILEVARLLSVRHELTWGDVDAIARRWFARPAPHIGDWLPHWPPLAASVRCGFLPPLLAESGGVAATAFSLEPSR